MSHPHTDAIIAAYNAGLHELKIAKRLGLSVDAVRAAIDAYWVEVRRRLCAERAREAEERRIKLQEKERRKDERRQRAIECARRDGERDARRFVRLHQLPKGSLPVYVPTPQEIEAACDAIRESWSPEERSTRWLIAHSIGRLSDLPTQQRHWSHRRTERRRERGQELRCVDYCIG